MLVMTLMSDTDSTELPWITGRSLLLKTNRVGGNGSARSLAGFPAVMSLLHMQSELAGIS